MAENSAGVSKSTERCTSDRTACKKKTANKVISKKTMPILHEILTISDNIHDKTAEYDHSPNNNKLNCDRSDVCDSENDMKTMKILYDKFILNGDNDIDSISYKSPQFDSDGNDVDSDYDDHFAKDSALPYKWCRVTGRDEPYPHLSFSAGKKNLDPLSETRILNPMDIFSLFFTDPLIDIMVIGTNKNAQKKLGNNISRGRMWESWKDVTVIEMKMFLGVLLDMGLTPLYRFRDYWADKSANSSVFTRERFLQIFWMFQVNCISENEPDKKKRQEDRIYHYIDYLDEKCRGYYIPKQQIAVYTSSLDDNGKVTFSTSHPNNTTNSGIRLYAIADCNTSYICTICAYLKNRPTDQFNRRGLSASSQIVLHLYQKLRDSNPRSMGHHLFIDRQFASMVLARKLIFNTCYMTATIYRNKNYLPTVFMRPTERRLLAYRYTNFLLTFWQHRHIVSMLSTWHPAPNHTSKHPARCSVNDLCQSALVSDYLRNISGMKSALYPASYKFVGKKIKSWREFFFWGLEVAVTNSYILYKSQKKVLRECKSISRTEFVRILINKLIGSSKKQKGDQAGKKQDDQAGNQQGDRAGDKRHRLDGKLHILNILATGEKRACSVCCDNNMDVELVQYTKYFCETCKSRPYLHPGDCFEKYHTMKCYRKEQDTFVVFKIITEEDENAEIDENDTDKYEWIVIQQEDVDVIDPESINSNW